MSQKNPEDASSENEDTTTAVDSSEKSSKLKIRTRTSSRNSPALLDSPKVVCDVSEDNPTRIKIHIENKSPEKVPLTSPVLSNKETTEETIEKDIKENQSIGNKNEATESIKDDDDKSQPSLIENNEKIVKLDEPDENFAQEEVLKSLPNNEEEKETNVPSSKLEQDGSIVITEELAVSENVEEVVQEVIVDDNEKQACNNDDYQPTQHTSSSRSPSPQR